MPHLLDIAGLHTHFTTPEGVVRAVDGVDLWIDEGEILGVVGESGCGKTVTALSIMGLVDAPGRIVSGRISFAGRDLRALSPAEMTEVRGGQIAMIFQQPKVSLNPVVRVGRQIAEQLIRRGVMGERAAMAESLRLLESVGIPGAAAKLRAYPHELSGGQAQRAMIAIALALQPRLLIADEPTTAVDVTVQAQIMRVLRERCRDLGTALILVTHDLGLVAQTADRVAVMYAGHVVEQAPVATLFASPAHPYTRGLLRSIPRLGQRRDRLWEIPGRVPNLIAPIPGCHFASRCADRVARCTAEPPAMSGTLHQARCWLQDMA